jgi:hypothetical protein
MAVAVCGTFFREPWNQMDPNGFKELGLGSMSLILLHPLLFHLDLRWGGTSYGVSASQHSDSRDVAARRHHE